MRNIVFVLPILFSCATAASAQSQEKALSPVRIYDGGWENIQITAAIASYVLEKALGIETEIVPSDVPDMQKQMVNGTIHLNMEMWRSLMNPWVTARLEEGAIVDLGPTYEKAEQAFYVPTYVIKGDEARGIEPIAPDLERADQLGNYGAVFAVSGKAKGEWLNCIVGWACREPNRVKMVTYGAGESFAVVEPRSEADLNAEIERRFKNGEPFMTYYWDPSPLLGRFDMTKLKEPEYSEKCQAAIDAAVENWKSGNKASEACAYEVVPISKFVTGEFADTYPRAAEVLERMIIGTDTVRSLAGYMVETGVSPEATALHFFKTRADLWKLWLTEDEAALIEKDISGNG